MTGQYPRLRARTRRRKNGKVVVYYFYDATADGNGEIPLGTDYTKAVARWKEITEHGTSEPATTGTLEEAFARWEAEVLPGYSSAETKRGYTKSLRMMRPALKEATWDQVDLPTIKAYLKKRTAKTQGNREMALLSVIWNWARGEGLVSLPWPAAGMERSKWKNKEKPRKMKVEDAVYAAIYAEAAQHIKDCMDLGSVTGMRLTDCIAVLMPRGAVLTLEASKTGKEAEWDLNLSQVLPGLVERRKALGAPHLMLLSLPNGRPVTQAALRYGWDTARAIAAQKAEEREDAELADAIKALYLRDMRKRAAQKAGSLEAAAELLQHSDKRLTERHYGGVRKLKPTG
ncbi:integrase [Acidovorax sp.]|uniref:integrase n=1 Tax=Acidovorax sp. TaxID=1872122 RepID=UPI0025C17307|nr:integrase [Acidovorax sp.]